MEKHIKVVLTVEATLIIDREEWPEEWSLKEEMAHQLSFSDAIECEIKDVVVLGQE